MNLLPGPRKDIPELFGYAARDRSSNVFRIREERTCPFLEARCTKLDHRGDSTGVCSVFNPKESVETIICPNRLYFGDYHVLEEIIEDAFGTDFSLIRPHQVKTTPHDGKKVVALGQNFGREVRVPFPTTRGQRRPHFVYTDWVLAQIAGDGDLGGFVGVEAQSIDITGDYRAAQGHT